MLAARDYHEGKGQLREETLKVSHALEVESAEVSSQAFKGVDVSTGIAFV